MNVVNFGKISIHNFKSVGEEISFDYRDYNGMTFIKGENVDVPNLSNGVGKSVVFVDALLMVLFGQLSNNVKNSKVFHRRAKSNIGWIKLQLFVNDKEWNIHCILQRSKSGNVSLSRSLYEGAVHEDNSCTKSSMSQTLKFISDDILGADADTFKNAVILSTSNIQNFFTLPRSAKDAYLDSVFMLSAFSEVYVKIKKSSNSLKKELSSQREVFDSLKENHEQIIAKSQAFISEKESEVAEIENMIRIKSDEINALKEKTIDIDHLEKRIEHLRIDVAKHEATLAALKKERDNANTSDVDISSEMEAFSTELYASLSEYKTRIDAEISICEKNIEETQSTIDAINTKIEEFVAADVQVNDAIKSIEDNEIAPLKRALSEKQVQITSLNSIKQKFESTYELLCDDCKTATCTHFEFDQSRYDKLVRDANDIEEAISTQDKLINGFVDKRCKVADGKKILETKVNDAETAIATFVNKNNALENKYKEEVHSVKAKLSAKEIELQDKAIAEYQNAMAENIKKNDEITTAINDIKDEIRSLMLKISNNSAIVNQIDLANSTLIEYVKRYETAKNKDNPFDSIILDGENKIQAAKETIKVILRDQRKFELLANIFDENGVKKHIVSSIVSSLNVIIKKYLIEMGTDYTVVFDEQFKYSFYTATGETDYYTFSSGERRRLDMAVMLALRDILFTNGLSTNILIVDEVLDSGIDSYALFAILNIFKNKTRDRNLGCIVISHRSEIFDDMTDIFDRTIVVKKEGSASSILTNDFAQCNN